MIEEIYFFDSYAIIEIINGNPHYQHYADCIIITTKLNLFEVCYSLLKDGKEQEVDDFLFYSYNYLVEFDQEIIKSAAFFRLSNKEKKLSMVDCIGYCTAKKLEIKFLTGDKEFEHFENIEFVK